MIKHLLKLVWNRKRANLLLMGEIFLSFLVVAMVVAQCLLYAYNFSRPLGFDYEDVWYVSMSKKHGPGYVRRWTEEDANALRQVDLTLRDLDEVEMVAASDHVPLGGLSMDSFSKDGRSVFVSYYRVTDELKEVLKLGLVRGRWFNRSDDALNWEPVVINQTLARELFGTKNPVGEKLEGRGNNELRVIGVIAAFRTGVFSAPGNFAFKRVSWSKGATSGSGLLANFLFRSPPEAAQAFEKRIRTGLRAASRNWGIDIGTLSQRRETTLKQQLILPIVEGIVAFFLLIMVGLGLSGVLWQNITQRTREIGLRRALGAVAGNIYGQFLGELLVMTTVAIAVGVAVIVQFELFDNLVGRASGAVYLHSLLVALSLIYALIVLCGLYPSWLATRVQPVEALHHE